MMVRLFSSIIRIDTRMVIISIVTRVVCIFSWRVSIVKDGQDSRKDSHKDGHDGTDSYHDGQHYQKGWSR